MDGTAVCSDSDSGVSESNQGMRRHKDALAQLSANPKTLNGSSYETGKPSYVLQAALTNVRALGGLGLHSLVRIRLPPFHVLLIVDQFIICLCRRRRWVSHDERWLAGKQ